MIIKLSILLIFSWITQASEDCCPYKSLGGHDYTLLKTDLALGMSHYCKNGCIYYRDDTGPAGDHWCFSPGDEEPQCRAKPKETPMVATTTSSTTTTSTTTTTTTTTYWANWGSWSECDNGGVMTRVRDCSETQDDECAGAFQEISKCKCEGGWNCCTSSSPCDVGEGDCDKDWDCKGSFVCGTDNCHNTQSSYVDLNQQRDCCRRIGKRMILKKLL